MTALVHGYQQVRPLEQGEEALIPVLMVGRGLQMLTRLEAHGQQDEVLLARLRWVYGHLRDVQQAVVAALG